ncbi:LPP20 lipoprotein [Fodinibius salinus]|uniref:LPP20 lipoprotein n=1 Tax=Fodinibius salinus TaxID=860790 RepID=A0A5D3YMX7_9BACT|nr:LPP20 family lipoprotein [Fodinibius salinus]TYP93499.1 LPP20 lipoprotein [Fodinibius salinus]
MKIKTVLVVLLAGMLFVGCSSSEEVQDDSGDLPSWYTNPPSSDSEYIYSVGEATSSRRSMARKQAMQNGRAQLAIKIQSEVSAMQKNYAEETVSGESSNYSEVFTDVSKTVAEQTLRGVEVDESAFYRRQNNTKHEVLMLVRMPVGEAANSLNKALENTLSKEEELYTKFKASKAFEDMQKSIEDMKNGNMPSEQ